MTASLSILGIRHHGPGSARLVASALGTLKPDAILIEGPPDAADILHFAAHEQLSPPVALLIYEPDTPSNAAYYPFASFSPEWQAITWGLAKDVPVRFIDLPQSLRPPRAVDTPLPADSPDTGEQPPAPADPLDQLAAAAGFSDGEAWWGKLIEERRSTAEAPAIFDSIRDAMAAARSEHGDSARTRDEPAREAHMRSGIRAAVKEGFERIAVICGAWHAPVLTTEALTKFPAKADAALLKTLTKRKTAATWIPWTYDRLSFESGYGAGVASPGWYEHLWVHHENISERWLTRVARLMRDEDLDASPASVIESVRLADSLAALRMRSIAGLEELGEATLSILCHGNPLPMRVIERKLIVGQRLGTVPDDVPSVPLQRDLTAQQKSLRMKVSADDQVLDLDQRKETDLARSRLLHRLNILAIPWGVRQHSHPSTSTFHEIWKLQWQPEFAVSIMEAARWGNTVEDAARACVHDRAAKARELAQLTVMLDDVMLADLPAEVAHLIARIQDVSAVGTDLGHLMDALPPLARVLRYGNVRKTDAAMVEPAVWGLLARIRAGLAPACASLDDDAAAAMRDRIESVHASLITLDRPEFLTDWNSELRKIGDAEIHGLVAGRCWRLLLDASAASPDDAAARLSLGLSRGNDPAHASAWLEGFLAGSGMVLVHDARLLAIVDAWVTSLTRENFEQICPIARRTFSTFERPERRQIGDRLKHSSASPSAAQATSAASDDFDPERASLVEPVLRLLLGDRLA